MKPHTIARLSVRSVYSAKYFYYLLAGLFPVQCQSAAGRDSSQEHRPRVRLLRVCRHPDQDLAQLKDHQEQVLDLGAELEQVPHRDGGHSHAGDDNLHHPQLHI